MGLWADTVALQEHAASILRVEKNILGGISLCKIHETNDVFESTHPVY
jgi:hypothetical protein